MRHEMMMGASRPKYFSDEDIAVLKDIYLQACKALDMEMSDLRRESAAALVMSCAVNGETNPYVILQRTLMQLRRPT